MQKGMNKLKLLSFISGGLSSVLAWFSICLKCEVIYLKTSPSSTYLFFIYI